MDTDKNYEFDSSQNETILTLAKSLQFVGTTSLVFGLVFAIGCVSAIFQTNWSAVITQGMFVVFTFTMGGLMTKAGKKFQAIAKTSGDDISHLMVALDNLRQVYAILSVIIILCVLLSLVALALSMISSGGGVA
jgi:hypothetical protein